MRSVVVDPGGAAGRPSGRDRYKRRIDRGLKMGVIRRRFLSLAAAAAAAPFALRLARPQVEVPSASQGSHFVFPGVQWEVASPVELGWSIQGLADAYQLFATLPPASIVVIDRGRIVVAWGDSARRVKLSSIRKSLLNALYGTPVHDGRINLDDTLEELEIDDDPPLTQREIGRASC